MNQDFYALTHAGIRALSPYVPGKTIEEVAKAEGRRDIIKLASNENAWGCSPQVTAALKHISAHQISLYPQSDKHPFRMQLAKHLKCPVDTITLSHGSDMLIYLLMNCFAAHQDKHVMTHRYAFAAYTVQANILGISVVTTPVNAWVPDVDAILAACRDDTAIIFLANPGNPTGTYLPRQDIVRLLKDIPRTTLLVLDEAYYEYAQESSENESIDLLEQYPNLIILRTFSKAYGLAGLRLGYAIAHPDITALLYRIQLPFVVSTVALIAAEAALSDQAFVQQTVAQTKAGLRFLENAFTALNIEYIQSKTNFITIHCEGEAKEMAKRFEAHGIITRPLDAYGMMSSLRITVGTESENQRLIDVCKTLLTKTN